MTTKKTITYWIVSSKASRDASIMEWKDTDRQKWTTDGFIKNKRFLPSNCKKDFRRGDSCILNVYGMKQLVADFAIASEAQKDSAADIFYDIEAVNEWDYPVAQDLLPPKYKKLIVRSPSKRISETDHHELLGIRNFVGNLRFNYKNQLPVHIKETDVEKMMVSNASLKKLHLVLQRYRSSSKTMRLVDDTPVKDNFLGGYRHGCQNDYENQTGIDAILAPV